MSTNNRRIKNFLIYPKFQLKLIVMCMGISLIAPLLIFSFQIYSFKKLMENGAAMGLPETHPYFVFLQSFQNQLLYVFLGAVFLSFLICLILGFLVSHRVAGPIVKLRNYFDRVGQGAEETEVHFRESDFFVDLARSYNKKFQRNSQNK
jgi:hypothetical protein